MALDLQSTFYASLITLSILWSVIGTGIAIHLAPIPKPRWADVLLFLFGGPVVWALDAFRGISALRERILRRNGVQGYTCCGGKHGKYSGGCQVADRLSNHPSR